MSASNLSLNFPVEAHFVVTDEIARISKGILKDAIFPRWLQIMLPVMVVLQALVQLPKLMAGRSPGLALGVFAAITLFWGLMFWRGRRKNKPERTAKLGQEMAVRFFESGLEFGPAPSGWRIDYSHITRIGRDERGLVFIIPRLGGLFVPTCAFVQPEQRDLVFAHIGSALKK